MSKLKDPMKKTVNELEADFEIHFVPADEGEEPKGHPAQLGDLDEEPMHVPRLVSFDPTRVLKGRLFSLKNNGTKKNAANFVGTTGRSFNYEEIYDEDPYGEEAFPDARVWKVYNDEAQLFDLERIEAWRDAIDVLLVFIGLFAAVVSTFLIETSKSLQPDYAQINVMISYAILRSLNTSVLPHSTLSPNILDPNFGEATYDNSVVNTLWYTSLTISLSTALLAMLIKQWLHQYSMTSTAGSARERARIRHFRFIGLEKYQVPFIIDLLPTLLHLALGLFLVGLSLYLKPLDNMMFGLVIGIAATPYTLYLISIIIPLIDVQCPYKSPPSFYIYALSKSVTALLRFIWKRFRQAWQNAQWAISHCIQQFQNVEENVEDLALRSRRRNPRQIFAPTKSPLYSLGTLEKETVSQRGHQLDVDGIVYLYQTSANTSARNIALETFGGLPPSAADVEAVDIIIDSDLHTRVRACRDPDRSLDNIANPGMERRHDCLIRALCVCPEALTRTLYDLYMQLPYPGETDPQRIFGHWLLPWFDIERAYACDFAALFTFASHQTFALPIWAELIRLATRHRPQDPVIMVILLSALHLPLNSSEVGAVTFGRAMQNPFVRSIGLAYLGIANADLKGTLPVCLSPVTSLLSKGNLPRLEMAAPDYQRFSPSSPPSISPIAHFLTSIIPPLFRSLANRIERTSPEYESEVILCNLLTNFFASPHINVVSWETFASAIEMWSAPFPESIQAITTSSTIRIILEEVRHRDELKEEDVEWVRKASGCLAVILQRVTNPELRETVCSSIQELDLLPLDMQSQPKTSTLHCFWQEDMCHHLVDSTYAYNKARSRDEWFEGWLAYLHAPERLTFLGSKVAGCEGDSLSLLCQIRPRDSCWPTVFRRLLSLFSNQVYLDTMKARWNWMVLEPRQRLSHGLAVMKDVLVKYHPSLIEPEFDIPQFDSEDNPIPSTSTITPNTSDPPLPGPSSAGFASGVSQHESLPRPAATPTDPLPRTLPSNALPTRTLPIVDVILSETTQSVEPYPSAMSPGSSPADSPKSPGNGPSIDPLVETTPGNSSLIPLANTSPAFHISKPPESPLSSPNNQPPSDATEHLSVDMAEPCTSTAQAKDLPLHGLLDLGRQSAESKVERGDLGT